MEKEAIRFIDRLYRDLYLSEEVLHHSTGPKTDKLHNIKEYLEMLKDMHDRASLSDNRKRILKRMYHDKYVIKKEDIPDSYYRHQERVAFEQGHGRVKINEKQKRIIQENVIKDQEESLDIWLDYFLSRDADVYPFWAKYWAFQGILKIGSFNVLDGSITKRTKESVSTFIDLNVEALSLSIDTLMKSFDKEKIDDVELDKLVKGGSFQKIYTYIISNVLKNKEDVVKRNEGIWIKYNRGSDHLKLSKSLKGYNTGWCTAGSSVAKRQLGSGDFYVYYTLDNDNNYKVPRVAIRMDGSKIGEIRGIGINQNLEPEMISVVEKKLLDFPDRDNYYKKVNDMKKLTSIYNKNSRELTDEELRFLYEMDRPIQGFGHMRDPRIDALISGRDQAKDYSRICNYPEDEIAFTKSGINKNTKYYFGDFDDTAFGTNLEILYGSIFLFNKVMCINTTFPKIVKRTCNWDGIKYAINVKFPEIIEKGSIYYYSSLKFAYNVTLPIECNSLEFCELKHAYNFVLPKKVNQLKLRLLESANSVTLPEEVDCLYLDNLKTGKGLVLPNHVKHLSISKAAYDDVGLDAIRKCVSVGVRIIADNSIYQYIDLKKMKDAEIYYDIDWNKWNLSI